MIAAGLLARNAVERGLDVPRVRQDESRARKPRRHRISRSVGASPVPRRPRLQRRRLRLYDLYRERRPASPEPIERAIDAEDLWTTSVLSGNRNFEARIHPKIRANYYRQPAARRRLWPRRADGHRPRTRPARNGCRRRSGLSRGHLARRRRDPRGGSRQCRFLDVRREVRLRVRGRRTLDGTRCADR